MDEFCAGFRRCAQALAATQQRSAEDCCGETMALGYRCEDCPYAKPGDKLVRRRREYPNPPPEGLVATPHPPQGRGAAGEGGERSDGVKGPEQC